MKVKNLILAISAFLIAIGCAFGTAILINPVYIKAKVSEEDPWQYLPLSLDCEDAFGTTCVVQVTITKSGSPVIVNAHLRKSSDSRTTCPIKLQGTTYSLAEEIELYDVNRE
jgi:hypothetical protein